MSVKIRVRDFQSIEDAEIEVRGLTVITGQNNTGKSAVVRAVQGAFTNARGSKFVRHGKPHCTVDVTFSDGQSLTWEKGEGVNRYKVNGKVLDKVGQSVPDEVSALGVIPIAAAGRELWPQFAPQFTGQVFLLDQPGSVLAESIADVTRVGVLNEALRNTQSDRRSLSSELKVRAGDVLRLEAQEGGFLGLDGVETAIQTCEALHARVVSQTSLLAELRDLSLDYMSALATVEELTSVKSVVLPVVSPLWDELDTLSGLSDLSVRLNAVSLVLEDLFPVRDVNLPGEDSLNRGKRIVSALSVLTDLRSQLRTLQHTLLDEEAIRASIAGDLPEATPLKEALTTLEGYRQVRDQLNVRQRQTESLQREAEDLTRRLSEAQEQVTSLLEQAGSCPICGHGRGVHDGCETESADGDAGCSG